MEFLKCVFLHFLLLKLDLSIVNGIGNSSMKLIYRDIIKGYQKETPPLHDDMHKFDLSSDIIPMVLNSFSETKETISVTMAIGLVWNDYQLKWNPSLYGNVTSIIITMDDIWLPLIYHKNAVDAFKPLGHDSEFTATVFSDGTVSWVTGMYNRSPTVSI